MLAALAEATRHQEICALVDATDSFDPASAAAAGIDLGRVLWIRIGDFQARTEARPSCDSRVASRELRALEQALQVTDLLLQGGGFGMVAIDLADVPPEFVRRVPLASWFRFRRVVEHTSTVLLVIEQEPYAKTCASLVLRTAADAGSSALCRTAPSARHAPSLGQRLSGINVQVEAVRKLFPVSRSTFHVFRY
jgi:hypothetical protein